MVELRLKNESVVLRLFLMMLVSLLWFLLWYFVMNVWVFDCVLEWFGVF